ncbi:MAG: LysR family transcriptional regulator [Pseudomonadota bacterium]
MKEIIAKNTNINPTPHLRALGYFVAVADHEGITNAAEALNLSPSVLSRSMSLLEERLGVPLFYRKRGAFRLTPEGVSLLAPASKMVAAAREALNTIEAGREEPSGLLRVGVHSEFGYGWFPQKLAVYRQQNPLVDLELIYDDAVTDLVRNGLDMALRFGQPKDVRIYQKKIRSFEIIAVSGPQLVDRKDVNRTRIIEKLPYMGRIRGAHPDRLRGVHRKTGQPFEFTRRGPIAMDNTLATLHAVEAGLGIAFVLGDCVQDQIEAGKLIHLLPHYHFGDIDLFAVFATSPPPIAVRRMMDLLGDDTA